MSNKKRYGLIGYPVKHSFSAAMHNAAFSYLGMNAAYELFEVSPEKLKEFLTSLAENNICGINVTIPHKESAVLFLEEKSFGVSEIGAVNTIRVDNNGALKGFNTDYAGFSRDIKELGANVRKTALIGAGGAAKAVVFALVKAGSREIAVFDIDFTKCTALAEKIRHTAPQCNAYAVDSIKALAINDKSILINASSVGMKDNDPVLIKENMLHKGLFVYDLIYNPGQTKLLKLAKDKGLPCSNGLKMLLYQGMLAFEHWTGQTPPEKVMFSALKGALEKCQIH